MFTRGHLAHAYGAGRRGALVVAPVNGWSHVPLPRGGAQGLTLPPLNLAMDPSDRTTWDRPVLFT